MYRRYYDGYARVKPDKDEGEVIVPQNTKNTCCDNDTSVSITSDTINTALCPDNKKGGLFSGSFETDDLILIGLLIFLLTQSDNDDPTLLIIIAFIFLGDFL